MILQSLLGNSLVMVKVTVRQLISKELIMFIRLATYRNKLQNDSV